MHYKETGIPLYIVRAPKLKNKKMYLPKRNRQNLTHYLNLSIIYFSVIYTFLSITGVKNLFSNSNSSDQNSGQKIYPNDMDTSLMIDKPNIFYDPLLLYQNSFLHFSVDQNEVLGRLDSLRFSKKDDATSIINEQGFPSEFVSPFYQVDYDKGESAYNLKILLSPSCRRKNSITSEKLTFYVKSSLKNGYPRRTAIRETWAKDHNVIFILLTNNKTEAYDILNKNSEINQNQNQENSKNQQDDQPDILLLEGYEDDWMSLAYKITGGIMHAYNCQRDEKVFNYVVFTDDDVHFFVNHLYRKLVFPLEMNKFSAELVLGNTKNSAPKKSCAGCPKNYFLGNIRYNGSPQFNGNMTSSKYHVDRSTWPFELWPAYSPGMGAFITPGVVPLMYKQSKYFPVTVPHLDDVYLANLIHFSNVYHWEKFLEIENDYVLRDIQNRLKNSKNLPEDNKKLKDEYKKRISQLKNKFIISNSDKYIQTLKDDRFNNHDYPKKGSEFTCDKFNVHPMKDKGSHIKVKVLRATACDGVKSFEGF